MKKTMLLFLSIVTVLTSTAQTVAEGNRHVYYERFSSAEKTFSELINQQPSHAEAWFGLTRALVLDEKAPQALLQLQNAGGAEKNDPWFLAAYGYALLANQKKDSAAHFLNEALSATRHKKTEILFAVAQAETENKAGNATHALELLEKAIKKDKDQPAYHVLAGDAWLKQKNGSMAYQAYNNALAIKPDYAPAHYKLGMIFVAQKSKDLYLDYFSKALAADAQYTPALYQLYAHYFYYDAAKAMTYFDRYMAHSDATIQRDYDKADMLYLNKKYSEALATAQEIMKIQGTETKPRIFKLMAYSYAGEADTARALAWMHRYISQVADSQLLSKDFALMAELSADSSGHFLAKAVAIEEDSTMLYAYFRKLADVAKKNKDYATQALWLEKYYAGNEKATNVDLFNLGLANYLAQDYKKADSVFGVYVNRYPGQSFGYYWQAKANVALDKDMKEGLAIPHYTKLVEVLQKDTANTNYKKWMAEAFGYMAAYETNTEKDYREAIGYFEKVLEVDPENESAKKYISLLEKDLNRADPGTH